MEEPTATTEPTEPAADPVAFTRERLNEIGEVWIDFAKQQAEAYKAKLPDAIKQYLQPSPKADPPEAPPAESEAA